MRLEWRQRRGAADHNGTEFESRRHSSSSLSRLRKAAEAFQRYSDRFVQGRVRFFAEKSDQAAIIQPEGDYDPGSPFE
jgi:hypothetical protein